MGIDVEIKKVIPLIYSYDRKDKYDDEKWSDIETITLITDSKNIATFTSFIRQIILITLSKQEKLLVRFSEINDNIMARIQNVLSKNLMIKTYPSIREKWWYYIPGMVASTIAERKNIDTIFEYWGNVDYIQFVIANNSSVAEIFKLLEIDAYKLSTPNLLTILSYAKFIITDSGDGNEAEIMFHKDLKEEVIKHINEAASFAGINISIQ